MSRDFEVTILASGSKGNAAIISAGEQKFLIDAGISCKQITDRMAQVDLTPQDLTGVILTHEHNDHVKGLPVFSRKYKLPVFANESTWQNFSKRGEMERSCCRILPKNLISGNLEIIPFSVPHDAAATVGYVFKYGGNKCAYLTDVGFVTDEVRDSIAGVDVLILEANHDIDMLKNGSYPAILKQRILSSRGHLSNVSAGWLLAQLDHLPTEIFLAHLSQENNLPSVALKTVRDILENNELGADTEIYVASQEQIVKNY